MVVNRTALISLAISLAVWLIFSWPLPRHVAEGIPMSHAGGGDAPLRTMQSGDHLQLVYYFWLFSDMITGETPWMYNPYEFHTGDEEARYAPDAYYAPFSWIFTLVAPWGGRALAYNLTGLFSLWLTYALTLLLARRYATQGWIPYAAALIAIILPYRWFCLLGGSPTGFAMAMTPLLLWGLDRAVRDQSMVGGAWAALAIILSYTSDLHVFFFNVLMTPAWCMVAFVARNAFDWKKARAYVRLAIPLLPTLAGLVAVIIYSRGVATQLADTHMSEGRAISEVRSFSPQRGGLFGWREHQLDSQIYLGYSLPLLILIGGALMVVQVSRRRKHSAPPDEFDRCEDLILKSRSLLVPPPFSTLNASGAVYPFNPARNLLVWLFLFGGVMIILLLAMGPHGPKGGWIFMQARAWIPEYAMIRQAGKVFAVLPPLLAVLTALAISSLIASAARRTGWIVSTCLLALATWEYARRIDPLVCLLHAEAPAYAAVAMNAEARGESAHALILPLWPGDSHFASLYQYNASLYRIRMINGYNPAINQRYFDDIYLNLESINQGWLTDAQIDDLRRRGIHYILLHEDMFPEKVSPFPVTKTLHMLLTHPRTTLLYQDGPVWAFMLLEDADHIAREWQPGDIQFPARYYELSRAIQSTNNIPPQHVDPTAWYGTFVRLHEPGQILAPRVTSMPPAQDLRWMIRLRGEGAFAVDLRKHLTDKTIAQSTIPVRSVDWIWLEIPFQVTNYTYVAFEITHREGTVDFDAVFLTAGPWPEIVPGESRHLPAALFFHAGNIDLASNSVVFRHDRDDARIVFYGPRLPIPEGEYRIRFNFDSPAPVGLELGVLHLQVGASDLPLGIPVIAGQPASFTHHHSSNLPFTLMFVYHARADITIREVVLTRLP